MSRTTREINRITGAVIGISARLIVLTLVVLLLYQGVTNGYAFGHELFYASSVTEKPGTDKDVMVEENASVPQVAKQLKNSGMITNEYSFIIQAKFFDYTVNPGDYTINTSMTSREILQMMNENTGEKEEK